jgi:hypothetical protein
MIVDHLTWSRSTSTPANRRRHRRAVALAASGGILVAGAVVAALVVVFVHPEPVVPTSSAASAPVSPGVDASQPSGSPSAAPSPSASASGSPSPSASRTPGPSRRPVAGGPRVTGWPDASSTGVPKSVALKPSSDLVITTAGTVINGLDVHGAIRVEADNVTIKNTRVTNDGKADWGIMQWFDASGLVIQDTQIRGNGTQEMGQGIQNFGGDLTVRRVDISHISDGIATVQGLIEDSYIHDPQVFDGDHVDLIQATSGPPSGKSLTIRHNLVINPASQTSAIALFQDFGVPHDTLVENNYLAGGAYTVYGGDGGKGQPTNVRFLNNTFGRDVYPNCGYNGPVAYWSSDGAGNAWSGNVWAQTGAPVTA